LVVFIKPADVFTSFGLPFFSLSGLGSAFGNGSSSSYSLL